MSIIFEAEITKRLTAFAMIFQRLEVFKIQMRVYLVFTTPNLGLSDMILGFYNFFLHAEKIVNMGTDMQMACQFNK